METARLKIFLLRWNFSERRRPEENQGPNPP
jgi:hypothetical protein